MSENKGWIAVDLDGCLAKYTTWKGEEDIGDPIPLMVSRVKVWIKQGKDVRIFTARAGKGNSEKAIVAIKKWCKQHIGKELPVTAEKDYEMVELWDDRCRQVETNTGRLIGV
jgi:hypothetical protein